MIELDDLDRKLLSALRRDSTQGAGAPKKYMVSGQQRRSHFAKALASLPGGMPVNTILFPMEGDPEAAALFWQLGVTTQGAFIAPSRDWP